HRWHWDWLALLAISLAYYLYAYYHYYPYEHEQSWSSGVPEGYLAARQEIDAGRYRRAVVVEQSGVSLIHGLFALRYDPIRYQAQGGSRRAPATDFHPEPGPVLFVPFELRTVDWSMEPR